MTEDQNTSDKAGRKARAKQRVIDSQKRIQQFKAAYAQVGIAVDDKTIARIAINDPVDLTSRMEIDPEEQ